jgi:hypothetical protein
MTRQEQPLPPDPVGGSLPNQLVNQLFSVGFDVHQALRLVGDDDVATRHLTSVLTRLDETIATVLHAGLTHFLDGGLKLERLVTDKFAELTRGLAGGFDLVTYLDTLTEHGADLPGVQAATFVLGEAGETPSLVVVAPHRPALRELCLLRPSPVWDTCLSGQPQTVPDLATDIRWPLFAARANAAGHHAVHTLPLRQRTTVLGALTVFRATPGALSPPSGRIAHGLADLATIGVLLHHAGQRRNHVATTGTDRTHIHQAEGILAERHHVPLADVAVALTAHAHRQHRHLPDMARAVINGATDVPVPVDQPDGNARADPMRNTL